MKNFFFFFVLIYGNDIIFLPIFALFYEQNPMSPYSVTMAAQYKMRRNEFNRGAQEGTKKYAMGNTVQ